MDSAAGAVIAYVSEKKTGLRSVNLCEWRKLASLEATGAIGPTGHVKLEPGARALPQLWQRCGWESGPSGTDSGQGRGSGMSDRIVKMQYMQFHIHIEDLVSPLSRLSRPESPLVDVALLSTSAGTPLVWLASAGDPAVGGHGEPRAAAGPPPPPRALVGISGPGFGMVGAWIRVWVASNQNVECRIFETRWWSVGERNYWHVIGARMGGVGRFPTRRLCNPIVSIQTQSKDTSDRRLSESFLKPAVPPHDSDTPSAVSWHWMRFWPMRSHTSASWLSSIWAPHSGSPEQSLLPPFFAKGIGLSPWLSSLGSVAKRWDHIPNFSPNLRISLALFSFPWYDFDQGSNFLLK